MYNFYSYNLPIHLKAANIIFVRALLNKVTADFSACRLTHRDGETVPLSASEAGLLSALVQSAGRVMSRSQLLDATTGRSDEPFDRSMDARISRLRRKLRDNPKSPAIIRTVYGSGYLFALPIKK